MKKGMIKNIISWIGNIVFILSLVSSAILFMACRWAKRTFNVSIDAIINTLASPLQGTSSDTVWPAVKYCLPVVIIVLVVGIVCVIWQMKKKSKIMPVIMGVMSLFSLVGALEYVQHEYDIIAYVNNGSQETSIYSQFYVEPKRTEIKEPEEKRNLLLIYLESMETTYADIDSGGRQTVNYMPYATKLAEENVSFSHSDKLGGLRSVVGSTWTMGALFTSSSALPFAFPVGASGMEDVDIFASGVYALGDFLESEGYEQEFLCGSDIAFAGRDLFYEQHGDYEIFDLFTAREKGYIPEDYFVFWGYEDFLLYEIAKDELLRLEEQERPFNLTMLTVDAHHIGGYICEKCENKYEDKTANVISCADRQLQEFIEWCKEQDFYADTTIVIVGDHPRMDTHLVDGIEYNERTLYNCFMNSMVEPIKDTKYRECSQLDMYPTILAAMGYEIEGNKLGLGVNLFSEEATLLETNGLDAVNEEFNKRSSYYVKRFSPELAYMIEDEESAIKTIYFSGEEYNATEYILEGLSEPEADSSWIEGKDLVVSIPIEQDVDKVHITIHVLGTVRNEYYGVIQGDELLCDGVVKKACTIGFDAKVENGKCDFIVRIPEVESPYAYGMSDDTRPISLKLTHMTVNLCD